MCHQVMRTLIIYSRLVSQLFICLILSIIPMLGTYVHDTLIRNYKMCSSAQFLQLNRYLILMLFIIWWWCFLSTYHKLYITLQAIVLTLLLLYYYYYVSLLCLCANWLNTTNKQCNPLANVSFCINLSCDFSQLLYFYKHVYVMSGILFSINIKRLCIEFYLQVLKLHRSVSKLLKS